MFGPKTEVWNSCFKSKCCDLCLNESKDDGNEKREVNHTKEGGGAEECGQKKEDKDERLRTGVGGEGKEEEDNGRRFKSVIREALIKKKKV